ncbi:TIGR03619 family F420-dependent LLM class oxidoreductase [Gordonia sp. HNM0687]|uniref:TIGR03619 family F420-dependent LLM class oxidoreductase n=1 Tax=Gordonia mangrovi TaxID=2665643 RepID=A0A6L7GZC2_9ACTN|nr:TIGR03619 family F420-dependent LLM class oxidoreductase [Gordonia mangrovi]MXP24205.1 TIGR03619 family F420-dependent LLM class oxidoreductase [Gordonia mangrovi]UVF76903.1 TIGR03619 family F420-dependent LLM class oxidoreductase [Gordonia mangrovi]
MTVFGISLLRANPAIWSDLAQEAERVGFESIWMSDHLVLPVDLDSGDYPDGKLPIAPNTQIFDVMVYLAAIAARTSTIRLGTFVYQLGLRDPFSAARAVATLDVVSGGRVELGVGAGWSSAEWQVAGLPFDSRGRRLDEVSAVCRRLWTEETVAHEGEFYSFPEVAFEPKPIQGADLPLLIGGESPPALRRAVRTGTGWIGMHHTPESVAPIVEKLNELCAAAGRVEPLSVTVAAPPGEVDVAGWRTSGVSRVIVAPWGRTSTAIADIRAFSRDFIQVS